MRDRPGIVGLQKMQARWRAGIARGTGNRGVEIEDTRTALGADIGTRPGGGPHDLV